MNPHTITDAKIIKEKILEWCEGYSCKFWEKKLNGLQITSQRTIQLESWVVSA